MLKPQITVNIEKVQKSSPRLAQIPPINPIISLFITTWLEYAWQWLDVCHIVDIVCGYIFPRFILYTLFSHFAHLWSFQGWGFGVGVLEDILGLGLSI